MIDLIPGKLYRLITRNRFYPMNIKNPDPFKDSIILPVGATILFLYSKSLQRFSDPEQVHHCFLFNNNIYTLAFYLSDNKEESLKNAMKLL